MHVNKKSKGDSLNRAGSLPIAVRQVRTQVVTRVDAQGRRTVHKLMTRDEYGRRVDRAGVLRSKSYKDVYGRLPRRLRAKENAK